MVLDVSSTVRRAVTEPSGRAARTENPAMDATPAESLVLVVAPGNGRFHPRTDTGRVAAGQSVGHLTVGQGRRLEVPAPTDLHIHGLLTRPGQLIMAGQALLWGRRGAVAA